MNCDKELLVGYLYDELTSAERESFEAHVQTCQECSAEVQELRATRAQLASWAPPEPDFGFRVIRTAAAQPAPRWRSLPAWGLAAAAVLVLAASAAMVNLRIRYDQQGLSVSTGWGPAAQVPPLQAPSTMNGESPSEQTMALRTELEAISGRLDALEKDDARGTLHVSGRSVDPELLRRLSALIEQSVQASEKRQRGELAFRVAQLIRDIDASRASDLVRVQQQLREERGLTDAELIRQGQKVDWLFRVSGQQQK